MPSSQRQSVRLRQERRTAVSESWVAPPVSFLQVSKKLLVFQADFVDQVCVQDDLLFQRNGPRLRVRLGIIDGDLHLEVSEVRPADLFSNLCRLGYDRSEEHTSELQ